MKFLQGGLTARNECLPCPPKMHCTKYAVTEFTSNNGSGLCDPGFYCKQGVNTSRPGSSFSGDGGKCPEGFYCPKGTDIPQGCHIGTYSKALGLKNETECTLCDYGHYCGQTGLNETSGRFIYFWNFGTITMPKILC